MARHEVTGWETRRKGPSGLRRVACSDFRHLFIDREVRPVSNVHSGKLGGVPDTRFNSYLGNVGADKRVDFSPS